MGSTSSNRQPLRKMKPTLHIIKVGGNIIDDEKKLSSKQQKIAKAAPPEDKITGADFAALRKGK